MKKEKLACWGCGHDYLSTPDKWKETDLTPTTIYGIEEHVCPDCYDEIPEDACIE